MSSTSPTGSRDRRRVVEKRLRALGRPRAAHRAPPPEGRLSPGEQSGARLRAALEDLGPVFVEFGRYLSSRVDLIARRDCMELATTGERAEIRSPSDVGTLVRGQLGEARARDFVALDPSPRAITRWTQQHDAWLASGDPVAVTLVRSDVERLLDTDLPLLTLVAPWLDAPADAIAAAIDDFSLTLRRRLDQSKQATAFSRLFRDAQAGGTLDAPRCHGDYCTPGMLTIERIDGVSIARALDTDGAGPATTVIDREETARQLTSAWMRQAVSGTVVPFDFDLSDIRLRDDRLVLLGGALESVTATERAQFLDYLVAAAAEDPEAAWPWISSAVEPGSGGEPRDELRRRLRQAVPFRDGEWSGDNRLAEQALVQWRATRLAGWKALPRPLHLYRGIHAVSAATTRLAPEYDTLRDALEEERLRLAFTEAERLLEPSIATLENLLPDVLNVPRRLDEILTRAADGKLRVKVHVPDTDDRRETRNRTISFVASLVALVSLTFFVRHLSPAFGANLEPAAALLVLIVGGWLLLAASRL